MNGWSYEEAVGQVIAWGIVRGIDSLSFSLENGVLTVNATKVYLAPIKQITVTVHANAPSVPARYKRVVVSLPNPG